MLNRQQIYNRLVNRAKALNYTNSTANIYAVKHTEREFQRQFQGDQLLDEIIRLFGNGHNIHGISRLLSLTRSEVLHALERGYTK